MGATVLYMSISLDGFIAGPNERPGNGLGDGGHRLHKWSFPAAEDGDFAGAVARLKGANRQIYDEMMSNRAFSINSSCTLSRSCSEMGGSCSITWVFSNAS